MLSVVKIPSACPVFAGVTDSRCCSCCLWSSSCRRTFLLLVSSNCSDWRNCAFCLQLARLRSAGVLGYDVFANATYKHCVTKQQFALPADSAVLTERFRWQNAGSLYFSCSEGALLLLAPCVWIWFITAWTIRDKSVGKLPVLSADEFKDCCLALLQGCREDWILIPIPIPYPYPWESPWESPYPRQPCFIDVE